MRVAEKTFAEELQTFIRGEASNTKPPVRCKVRKLYDDKKHADILINGGVIKYVQLIGTNVHNDDEGLLVYLDEDRGDYVAIITDNSHKINTTDITEATPLTNIGTTSGATQHEINQKIDEKINTGGGDTGVLMVGSFTINNDGDLIVTLPTGTLNPYHIDSNGDLIYSTNPINGGT